MALKAGYYGIKKKILSQLLGLPADISDIRSEQAILGAKNLLNNKNAVSKELNGLTFTVNDDKSVTVNGTATADTSFSFFSFADNYKIPEGDYILSDEAGYYNGNNDAAYLTLARKKDDGATNYDITTGRRSHSKTFSVNYSNYNRFSCYLFVIKDTVLNNLTFRPMLRLASDPDDTYAPYAMTNRELTNKPSGIDYSTSEQLTGLKWIDGKDIYQKTYNIGDATSTNMLIDTLANVGNLIEMVGSWNYQLSAQDEIRPIPHFASSSTMVYPLFNKTNGELHMVIATQASTKGMLLTIKYTKSS